MKPTFQSILLTISGLAASFTSQAQAFHVQKTYHIASAGRWDYIAVCPVNDNIYVSHTSQVNIINKTTGDSVGVILNTDGVHGIAFAPEFKKGFTSNGRSNTVSVFDIKTNAVLTQIKTGENPDAIMYDDFSKKIYVCNGRSNDLTIIDPATNQVVKTVTLGGKPETAVSDQKGKLFINIEDKNEVVVLDTKTWKVENRWKTGGGEEPSGLAIDTKTGRLFSGCGNKKLIVLNSNNGKVINELPIGNGCDGVGFDAGTNLVFSSNGEGTLTVIKENSADNYTVLENAVTKKGARTLAVDEQTHKVYLPTADFEKPTAEQKRPGMVPGSFQILVVGQ